MANRTKVFTGALLALVLAVGLYFVNRYWVAPATARQAQAKSTAEHPFAPQFSLTDISGQKLNLADYKGKAVLLDFWATWCGPCRIEIPAFVELQNRYRDQGFAIIGISMDDSPEPVRDFYKQFKMNYPVALGDEKLGELYGGILGMPTTFLIGRDGRIYAKHIGAADPAVFEKEIRELLAAHGATELTGFKQVGGARPGEDVEVSTPAEVNSEVPGVDLSKLNAAEITQFKKQLSGQKCPCGSTTCPANLLKCRQFDSSCGVSRKLTREQLEKFQKSRI